MKLSTTTIAGTTAAIFFAASDVPGAPAWLTLSCKFGAAAAVAVLGKHSAECPANCPGTNELGHPRPWPQSLFLPIAVTLGVAVFCTLFSGCTSPNPLAGPGHPDQPAYVVSPSLVTTSNTVQTIAGPVGTATGTGPLIPYLVAAAFGIVGALSQAQARHQSQVSATMAAGVASAGVPAMQAVLTHAADSPKFATIAGLINSALPDGQAPGQAATVNRPK